MHIRSPVNNAPVGDSLLSAQAVIGPLALASSEEKHLDEKCYLSSRCCWSVSRSRMLEHIRVERQ